MQVAVGSKKPQLLVLRSYVVQSDVTCLVLIGWSPVSCREARLRKFTWLHDIEAFLKSLQKNMADEKRLSMVNTISPSNFHFVGFLDSKVTVSLLFQGEEGTLLDKAITESANHYFDELDYRSTTCFNFFFALIFVFAFN